MKLVTILAFLFCPALLYGQIYEWTNTIGNSLGDDGHAVVTDNSSNIYTLGNFEGVLDVDPGVGVDLRTSNGGSDLFLQKVDDQGSLVWAITMGGSFDDSGNGIATDLTGNVYICGAFVDAVDMNPGIGTDIHTSNGTALDAFIVKLSQSGEFLWAKSFGGVTWNDVATAISSDDSGNLLITGYFRSSVDFNSGTGTDNHTSNGGDDVFITQLDSSGNYNWTRTFGGSGKDHPNSITTSPLGYVYTSGTFNGTVDFDPSGSNNDHQSTGASDVFVQKLDSSGNFLWAKTFGSTIADRANSVSADDNGNVYIGGYFQLSADMNPDTGVDMLVSNGFFDAFVSKFDASGNYLWSKSIGGIFDDEATGTTIDDQGNLYTTGYFSSTVDFDPGTGVREHTAVGTSTDVFLLKLTSNGDYFLSETFGGTGPNSGVQIAADDNSNVYIIGTFTGSPDFNPAVNTDIQNSVGDDDVFLWKYNDQSMFGVGVIPAPAQLNVYPNPSSKAIRIVRNNVESESTILRCYDLLGNLVLENEMSSHTFLEINVSDWESGTYILQLSTNSRSLTAKFVRL